MKKIFLMGFAALLFASCGNNTSQVEATEAGEVAQAEESALELKINTEQSVIEWIGSKHLGKEHHGSINLSGGVIAVEDGVVKAGDFTADMTSIKNFDLPEDGDYNQGTLEGHLKSEDFFDVENHPNATFHITSVSVNEDENGNTHTINGNLTIKGVSKGISFPAKVDFSEDGLNANASFAFNRLDWGVAYDEEGVKNFLDGIIKKGKDDFVKNEIQVKIKLVANQS